MAGVSETIFAGSLAIVTLVPSSSVSVSGNVTAAADGLAAVDGTGVPVAAGVIELVASGGIGRGRCGPARAGGEDEGDDRDEHREMRARPAGVGQRIHGVLQAQ